MDRKPDLKSRMRETATAAILDAVEALAVERGVDATSIAAIAERAGVAVGTLYNYFPDREGMFIALFRARRAEIAPRIAAAATAAAELPFEERLRAFMRGANAAFDDKRAFIQLAITMDATRLIPNDTSLLEQIQQHVHDILSAAAATGAFSASRVDAYMHVLIGAMRGLKNAQVAADEVFDADFLVDTFLHGVKGASRPR